MEDERLSEEFLKEFSEFKDLCIQLIEIEADEGCRFTFSDGCSMVVKDGGQSCCETRWMTCDDDLTQFKSACLTGCELLPCPERSKESEEGVVECSFLRIDTTVGSFRLCMHNEHNGFYGGFYPVIGHP